MHNRNHVHWSK